MKKLTAMILALVMVFSLAACGNGDTGSNNPSSNSPSGSGSQQGGDAQGSTQQGGQDDIVLWTLSNDLKQFAERYEEQTGNHVEVVVFLTINEFSQHKEAAQAFIEFCTLNDDTAQWWLKESNGDVVNNKAVLENNKDYQNESFGNQNTYAFYLAEMEKIDFNLTGYDDACKDEWGKAITAVKKGEKTKEQAVQDFYQNVITLFPELSVPADAPYYNG